MLNTINNTVPILAQTVLDDVRYVGKSFDWLQMADKELDRKKEWSYGDYAMAIFSVVNFTYSVCKTVDDGAKLINAALASQPAKTISSAPVLRKAVAVKKTAARIAVRKRALTKPVKYRRLG